MRFNIERSKRRKLGSDVSLTLVIESSQNKSVKEWKKLKTKKGRDQQGAFLIEGDHLIEEAMDKLPKAAIERIIVNVDLKDRYTSLPKDKVTWVSAKIAEELADTENSQGVFAVIKKKATALPRQISRPYLFLDAIQDPGNLGTMIRTAAAAGFSGVVCGKGTVDPYNMKVLRSGQGMHFSLSIFEGDLNPWMDHFQDLGLPVFGTSVDPGAQSYKSMQASCHPFALLLGNEGQGVDSGLLEETDLNLYIPLAEGVESLNVAVAAGVLMFHLYDNR